MEKFSKILTSILHLEIFTGRFGKNKRNIQIFLFFFKFSICFFFKLTSHNSFYSFYPYRDGLILTLRRQSPCLRPKFCSRKFALVTLCDREDLWSVFLAFLARIGTCERYPQNRLPKNRHPRKAGPIIYEKLRKFRK